MTVKLLARGLALALAVTAGASSAFAQADTILLNGKKQLTMRVSYYISSQNRGKELEDYKNLTQLVPSNFGDDMLRFGGIGEIVTWGAWTNNDIAPEVKKSLADVLNWAADNRVGLQIHWNPNQTITHLIDILEDIAKRTSIKELRWWVNHLHDATEANLTRLKNLNVAWSVQDSLYFSGDDYKRVFGVEIARTSPPVATAFKLGVHVAGRHGRASRILLQSLHCPAMVS